MRRDRVGFVFQAFNLIGALTVEENILLPFRLSGARPDRGWLDHVVARVGLGDRLRHRPAELSGGQQQRVAIARALVTRPEVVFCDEPTGALDTQTAAEVLALLRTVVDETGQTVVMVTHDPVAASYADRVLVSRRRPDRPRHTAAGRGAHRRATGAPRPPSARLGPGGMSHVRSGLPTVAPPQGRRRGDPSGAHSRRGDSDGVRRVPRVRSALPRQAAALRGGRRRHRPEQSDGDDDRLHRGDLIVHCGPS
jgi:putative ABC transport system ATP-binding protein